MKSRNTFLLLMLGLIAALCSQPDTVFAQETAFTYQGRLNDGSGPYTGNAEFQVTPWDAFIR